MSSLSATEVERSALPIISLAALTSPDTARRVALAREIRAACRDTGFFYVQDHGISGDLQARVFAQARRFFALPTDVKMRIDIRASIAYRGYEPMKTQTLEPDAPPDLKEGFSIDRHLDLDDPAVVAREFGAGPNHWPDGVPGFRETIESYQAAMIELSRFVMRSMALSLELAEDALDGFCDEASAMVRLVHYPPQPAHPEPNEKGCGAHTDWGAFTFLLQDDAGGLQVQNRDGTWLHAMPIPGTFVVNVGDMLARWTNGRYKSTMHRVVNVSGRDRISVPFFFMGKLDYPVTCIPSCLEAGKEPLFAPTTPAGHLQEMIRRTYL